MLPVTSILLMFTAASAASLQQASAQQCKDCKADELSLVQLRSQPILRQNHTLDVADSSTKGNYCVKITTGTSSSNDGTLSVSVFYDNDGTMDGAKPVPDGADYAKGSTVVEQCYSGHVVDVQLQNPTNNAWTGSVETSTDGGMTYAATICGPTGFDGSFGSCTTGSDGAHVVVDGNADSANQAQTQCFNGQWCNFKPQQGKYCIKITTGTSSSNDGTLAAKVTFQSSSSSEFQLAVADGADYAKGSTVLEQCYIEAVLSVDVQNPTTNAWTGSIESSTDGGITYAATICDLVDGGCSAGSDGAQVVVDGNADSANQAPTHCFNGQSCTFKPQGMEIPAMCSWAMAYQGVSEGTDSCSSGCSDDSCQGVDDCQVQCAQCAECVGFDYCLPGANCGGYRCWLKKQITYVGDYQVAMPTDPAAASDNTWLSYRAGGATSCSVDETCNWAVASEGISEGTDTCPSGCSDDSCQGVDDCVQLCAQCGDCVGFDYCLPGANCEGYRCWLKKQITYNGEYQEAQPTDAAAASGSWLSYSTATTACTADSKRCDTWCSDSKFITDPKFCDWKECGGCTRCQVA